MPSRTYHDQYANKFIINSGETGASVVDDLTVGGAATVAETLVVTGVLTATGGVAGAATQVTVADESSDTTCFPLYVTAATGDLPPKSGSNLTFNSSTGALGATSFTGAVVGNVTGDVTGDLTPAVEATEHGAGIIGTGAAPTTYRWKENGVIITDFKVDVEGLASVATANDVIGLSAGGNAYIRQYNVATDGVIFKAELICLETPAGGDNDINVVANASGTIAYDGAGGTTYGIDGGDAVAGQVIANLVQGLTTTHYFYLTAGTGDTAAAYTAGQFIFRTYGHAVLA